MSRLVGLAALAFGLYAALVVTEMVRSGEEITVLSVAVDLLEVLLLAGAVALTAFASVEARAMRRERQGLMRDLRQARQDGERWRAAVRGHVEGLSQAIARQFRDWDLTAAEADVAGLMLKGLSHREIARARGGAEATVRQHAASVYRKSGLSSRAQLTAFFLEDLLAPADRDGIVSFPRLADDG